MSRFVGHYLYYLLTDRQIVWQIWSELTGRTIKVSSADFKLQSSPMVIDRADITWGWLTLFSQGNFLILELASAVQDGLDSTLGWLRAEFFAVVNKLDELPLRIGETTLVVAEAEEMTGWLVPIEEVSFSTRFGQLTYIKTAAEEQRHLYRVNPTDLTEEGLNGLRSWLPLLEKAIFTHNARMRYLGERTRIISAIADEIEQAVSAGLHQRFGTGHELPTAEELEAGIGQLSKQYGTLAGYYRLLRESQTILDNSFTELLQAARRLMGPATESDLAGYLSLCQRTANLVQQVNEQVTLTMGDVKAGIEVARTQVDLLRSKESVELQRQFKQVMDQNVALQRESLTLQIAAGFVEFMVLAYYSFSLWKYLSEPEVFHRIPAWLTLLLAVAFAGDAVYFTHLLAHNRRLNQRLVITAVSLLATIILMTVLSAGVIF